MLKHAFKSNVGRRIQQVSTRSFAKEIRFGVDGRAAMLKGVNTLADAVQVSCSTIIEWFLNEASLICQMLIFC
jgi:hypothetical protein